MDKHAVWSTFRAKPGKASEVEAFLKECQKGIEGEPGTSVFYVLRTGPGQYATFDTFQDDAAFQTHLHGPTARAVMDRAPDLFEQQPAIVQGELIAAKPRT